MSQTGRRRGFRSWFVEPFEQVRLGLMFLVVNIVFGILIFGVFAYFINDIFQSLNQIFQLSSAENIVTFEKFRLPVIVLALLIVSFISTTILVSVKYTHAIYGPLVSIHRFLDDLLSSNKPIPLKLRDGDQLHELADKLNELSEKISKSS